jgi:predicted amidohydrolase
MGRGAKEEVFMRLDLTRFTTWSPDESQEPVYLREGDTLGVRDGGKTHCFGKWLTETAVQEGQWYSFRVEYRTEGVAHEPLSVYSVANWMNAGGDIICREYLDREGPAGQDAGWRVLSKTMRAPEGAADVQWDLSFCEAGSVRYRNLSLSISEAVPPRPVRIASAFFTPRRDMTLNLETMMTLCDRAGTLDADAVLFTEFAYDRGAARFMRDRCVTFPGELTERFSAKARQHNMHVLVNLTEEAGGFYYNSTAVIDRQGALAGRYRKTHLPTPEKEAGYCPGGELPVFALDFGTVGILTCFDLEYPEAGRTLRNKGAEIVFVPTVGNYFVQTQMQARWNGMYFVVSGGDGPQNARIVNPAGETISSVDGTADDLAFASIDLNEGCRRGGMGFYPYPSDARSALLAKRREDLYE